MVTVPGFRRKQFLVKPGSQSPWDFATLSNTIEEVIAPGNFFVHPLCPLQWLPVQKESIPWEIFRGRLLLPKQTRQQRTFVSWNIRETKSAGTFLSVKLDAETGDVFVVRGMECYVQEGFENDQGEMASRESVQWVQELVGIISLPYYHAIEDFQDELQCKIFYAVIGLSRLPLTSVEAPHPYFSLGWVGYWFQDTSAQTASTPDQLLQVAFREDWCWLEKVKAVEFMLRTTHFSDFPNKVQEFQSQWAAMGHQKNEYWKLLCSIVNEVSLTPYTRFEEYLLQFVSLLVQDQEVDQALEIDFLSYILRQLGRHLTAYDLDQFHNRGANYPDALFLDVVLKRYLQLMEEHPGQFLHKLTDSPPEQTQKRLRRRALRQGWFFRKFYEGHPVPDSPTSPGENRRRLPELHGRVPDEQLENITYRKKKLYSDESPLELSTQSQNRVFSESLMDLKDAAELKEFGTAVFIDRPLGCSKYPGEGDQTLLFSHLAFSLLNLQKRLNHLFNVFPPPSIPWVDCEEMRDDIWNVVGESNLMQIPGIPAETWTQDPKRVVSLSDANRSGPDFVFFHTTNSTFRQFWEQYPLGDLISRFNLNLPGKLLVPGPAPESDQQRKLILYDGNYSPVLEMAMDTSKGYVSVGGREYPTTGLQVLRVYPLKGPESGIDLTPEDIRLGPDFSQLG